MLRLAILLLGLALTISAFPQSLDRLPEPGELALLLNEEEFEDYLDYWLEIAEPKWVNQSRTSRNTGKLHFNTVIFFFAAENIN